MDEEMDRRAPSTGNTDQRGNLLVIDDEAAIVNALHRHFSGCYQVFKATSAEDGYDIMTQAPIQVIISDQHMPGMTGAEFFSIVKREFPDAIRLLLTGRSNMQDVIQAINDGDIFRYIKKPWDPAELNTIVAEAFERHNLIAANQRLLVELKEANALLEQRVAERTEELAGVNAQLLEALESESRLSQFQSQLVRLVSHEFRTPLTVIMGAIGLMEAYLLQGNTEQAASKVDQVNGAVREVVRLVSEIEHVGQFRDRNVSQHDIHQPVYAVGSAKYAAQTAAAQRDYAGEIAIVSPSDDLQYTGDPTLFVDIMTELFDNAIKFGSSAGSIKCEFSSDDTHLTIRVSDCGIGIVEEDPAVLFEPFVRGANAGTIRGIGLGLTIVSHAVHVQNGQVELANNDDGGVEVVVRLPLQQPGAAV
jgi:K+-sensing histidine kinase KdpD